MGSGRFRVIILKREGRGSLKEKVVFEPCVCVPFQAEGNVKRKGPGAGVGLMCLGNSEASVVGTQ